MRTARAHRGPSATRGTRPRPRSADVLHRVLGAITFSCTKWQRLGGSTHQQSRRRRATSAGWAVRASTSSWHCWKAPPLDGEAGCHRDPEERGAPATHGTRGGVGSLHGNDMPWCRPEIASFSRSVWEQGSSWQSSAGNLGAQIPGARSKGRSPGHREGQKQGKDATISSATECDWAKHEGCFFVLQWRELSSRVELTHTLFTRLCIDFHSVALPSQYLATNKHLRHNVSNAIVEKFSFAVRQRTHLRLHAPSAVQVDCCFNKFASLFLRTFVLFDGGVLLVPSHLHQWR